MSLIRIIHLVFEKVLDDLKRVSVMHNCFSFEELVDLTLLFSEQYLVLRVAVNRWANEDLTLVAAEWRIEGSWIICATCLTLFFICC